MGYIGRTYRYIILLIARSPCTETAHHDKLFGYAACFDKRFGEISYESVIYFFKIVHIFTLGNAQIVNDNIPLADLGSLKKKLLFQLIFVSERKVDETDTSIGKIRTTCRRPYSGPCLISSLQSLFNDKSADKSAGSGYQDSFLHDFGSVKKQSLKIRRFIDFSFYRRYFSDFSTYK